MYRSVSLSTLNWKLDLEEPKCLNETRGANEAIDFNDELRNRREKLAALRQQGVAFPNDFRRDHTSDQLHEEFDAKDNQNWNP